jgi:hypothetical protein
VDEAVDFDALGLHALFGRGEERVAPLARFTRVVCWFGAGDADFVARLTRLVPGAVVAAPHASGRTVWEHLLATVGVPPAEADRYRVPLVAPARLVEEGRRVLAREGWDGSTPIVLAHPGAGGVAKRWPAEGFAAALERVASVRRVEIVIHDGPADHEAAAELAARLRAPSRRLREPALTTLAGALAAAAAYLGNDSGVSHLASALGTRSVALFTRDKLDWRPWTPGAEPLVVETSALASGDVERVAGALLGRLG